MPSPFFSIIIPSFNAQDKIQIALDSILRQKFTGFEIIIVDGLSKDNTMVIVKENAKKDNRINFISEKDNGVYDAMNKGIKLAKGEWLYFLGSDDYLYNDEVLHKVYDALNKTNCDILYGNVLINKRIYDREFDFEKLLRKNISHQSMFFNRKVFAGIGGFNIKYKAYADWGFNINCFKNNPIKIKYADILIAEFSKGGVSSSHDVAFLKEILIPEKLHFLQAAGPGYLKKIIIYDDWWRLLRNAQIRDRDMLASYAENVIIPQAVRSMVAWQSRIPPGMLRIGSLSKSFMFLNYIRNFLIESS